MGAEFEMEFERDQWALTDEVCLIVGVGKWLVEYGRLCKEGKIALILEKGGIDVGKRCGGSL